MELTDIDAVERVAKERSFAQVVVLVVDRKTPHAADEAARCPDLWSRFTYVLEPAEEQFSTESHLTEQTLDVYRHTAMGGSVV